MAVVKNNEDKVKAEADNLLAKKARQRQTQNPIDISSGSSSSNGSSSSDSSDIEDSLISHNSLPKLGQNKRNSDNPGDAFSTKKPKVENFGFDLPAGFLAPLPSEHMTEPLCYRLPSVAEAVPVSVKFPVAVVENHQLSNKVSRGCKQFWKAGDYEGGNAGESAISSVSMDHVRVHPKFLHSNATSHKWALGAFAELLDNALDEVCNGASYVCIDMLKNQKDKSKMLLVEDNGGGMNPEKMRSCMSLGYSSKSKMANTIGQYGNGFKTSTMRLGADVIVFSQSPGKDGKSPTRSVGMLSYTFLTETGQQDIVVPIIDYEQSGHGWNKIMQASEDDWYRKLDTIVQWSPYASEADLLQQFDFLKDRGTRIIIYNLWEDDEGKLELDFETDEHDIQIRGVNRDVKNIEMAKNFRNSRHFLTYRHSLRSYASILYLRLPTNFRMVLRGKDIEHHNIVNDMMLAAKTTYKPVLSGKAPTTSDMVANVTIGFVKDARYHIDVQGFNVYHKNRLIKPFWRVWNAAGSSGRGVLGVLEANFVEPAHDKQGFERTIVLSRLEAKLVSMQKAYWFENCHEVGYAPRRPTKNSSEDTSFVPCVGEKSTQKSNVKEKSSCPPSGDPKLKHKLQDKSSSHSNKNANLSVRRSSRMQFDKKFEPTSLSDEASEDESGSRGSTPLKGESQQGPRPNTRSSNLKAAKVNKDGQDPSKNDTESITELKAENHDLRKRLDKMNGDFHDERERCKSLEGQLKQEKHMREVSEKELDALIGIIEEERKRRDEEEERLRKRLTDASVTIDELLEKVKRLESRGVAVIKKEYLN
ncbi:hypothetical protein CCACVL1_06228 [Corchorus capsularis]|uniref:Morc S5 domain-containing protein n=1 Tax=Corchorus capsularis TaxID=210143 RepID=A0A1R3JGQ8_COCAP|nr:hypothetical protein CCACVL1_06228 [Corchorus capsularis]